MNLPLTVASRAAKAFQDREDARTKEKYGTAHDPGEVPIGSASTSGPDGGDVAAAPTIAAGDVLAALRGGRPVCFVDVRSAAAYAKGHIRGSVSMPLEEVNVRVSELPWDAMTVAVCDDGKASAKAVAFFQERGQEDTFALAGGLGAWKSAGGELVG